MPRKKNIPTIIDPRTTYDITPAKLVSAAATTEPDTTLNPDRAQVAAVADLPHAHEAGNPPPSSETPTPRDAAEVEADLVVARTRIADLEAELAGKYDADQAHASALNYRRGIALDDIRCAILDTGHPLGDDSDPELTPLRLVREVLAKVPRTAHDHAAGYLAITSGNVRAAWWKRNILHDIRDPDMVIGQIDHLTDGWAPSVKGAASPPLKTEAEARAWCEARCGWTVVP